jgi:hypothetical protein
MAPFELHINVGPCRVAAYPKLHQAVVHPNQHHGDNNQNYQDGDYHDTPQ